MTLFNMYYEQLSDTEKLLFSEISVNAYFKEVLAKTIDQARMDISTLVPGPGFQETFASTQQYLFAFEEVQAVITKAAEKFAAHYHPQQAVAEE